MVPDLHFFSKSSRYIRVFWFRVQRAFGVIPTPSACYRHNCGYSIPTRPYWLSVSFCNRQFVARSVSHMWRRLPTPAFYLTALLTRITMLQVWLQYINPLRLSFLRWVTSQFGSENTLPHLAHVTFVRARLLGINTTDSYNLTYAMLCVVTWFFTKACLVYLASNTNGWVWEDHLRTLSASIRFNISLFFTARSIPARVLNLIFVQQSAQT